MLSLCKSGTEKDIEKYHLKWLFQEKMDGVRCVAVCSDEGVQLKGRSGTDYTSKFPEIVEELKSFRGVFDGEIVCDTFSHTESRVHTENKLKIRLLTKEYPAKFYIFDEISDKTLLERFRGLTKRDFGGCRHLVLLKYSFDGVGLWERMKRENKEGLIIKNPQSKYSNGRSWDWIKVKNIKSQDLIVNRYDINPAGIRVESKEGIAVQISGSQHKSVKEQIDETGSCKIEVNYLNETEGGKLRMPTFKCKKE